MNDLIRKAIADHQFVASQFRDECMSNIKIIAEVSIKAIKNGGKIFFFGCGGSAADSQHLATELTIRFSRNRRAIPAVALTTDASSLTACANDFGFEHVFSRQLEALATKGDIAIGISTSGNSQSVVNGLKYASERGLKAICMTGQDGGKCKDFCNVSLKIPSDNTARIQEFHILAGHIICDLIEEAFSNIKSDLF